MSTSPPEPSSVVTATTAAPEAAPHPLWVIWGLCRELDRRANLGLSGRPNPIPAPPSPAVSS